MGSRWFGNAFQEFQISKIAASGLIFGFVSRTDAFNPIQPDSLAGGEHQVVLMIPGHDVADLPVGPPGFPIFVKIMHFNVEFADGKKFKLVGEIAVHGGIFLGAFEFFPGRPGHVMKLHINRLS